MRQLRPKLTATLFLLLALLTAYVIAARAAELTVAEAPLNPDGRVFEVNLDEQGYLWLADGDAGEIWRVNRATGAYTVFEGVPDPSDARRAPDGSVWWGDLEQGRLGRLEPATGALTWWNTPGATSLFGIHFTGDGRVWTTAELEPQLYSFDPPSGELCTYTLPLGGSSYYLESAGNALWFGDSVNSRLYRLTPATDQLTYWELPVDSEPYRLALSPAGELWYADPNLGFLGRLRPAQNQLTLFNPPRFYSVRMLGLAGNQVWYTYYRDNALGTLDPAVVAGDTSSVTRNTATVTPACITPQPVATGTATTRSGTLQWSDAVYPLIPDGSGWQVYELSQEAQPEGIASDGAQVWFVDPGRQVLGRIDYTAVTACVVEDEDGDVETTDDRSPLPGWTVYLTIDGVREEAGRITDESGCARWANLAPDEMYGVEQVLQAGWLPLGDSSHNFGVAVAGVVYTHTFVNTPIASAAELFLPLLRAP